ncbi:type III pantothenate kinase [Mariniflexile jejuense]|uniref:Type III pantothenate kinase n=1 Tax=Mariniflexile jejuense TaxID=1173582 RepID=A0ABW3JPT7_9FLAO
MNLIIDVGNTLVKLAIFENDEIIIKKTIVNESILDALKAIKNDFKAVNHAILSTVGKLDTETIKVIKTLFDLLILSSEIKLPFISLYETPKTLGVDRIALVCASVKQFKNTNVLIIDAGTCITYDFINTNNEYLGGAISPGLGVRYKSLNTLTANLPLLDVEMPEGIIGKSTSASIHSGVVYGVLKEIDGVIEEYKQKYSDLTVILTGGDSNFLSKQLKSSIFATPNFLLVGLNYILQFNSNE